jgi:putative hydrolase of the HAD superfamily
MLKAITLDFWNTMYDDYNLDKRNQLRMNGIMNTLKQNGFNCSLQQVRNAMEKMMEHFTTYTKTTLHEFPSKKQVDFIFRILGFNSNREILNQALKPYDDSALQEPPLLINDVLNTIKKLSEKYKLAIISNTGKTPGKILRIILKKDGLFDFFSTITFSDEVNYRKPHKRIFEITLHNLGVEPENSLHVGDMYETDIAGAMNTGMNALLFDRKNYYSHISDVKKFSKFSSLQGIIQKIS